jgi:excisionase family DNA binding protein
MATDNSPEISSHRVPQILTIGEVCDLIGISHHRVRGMIHRDELITLDFGDGVPFISRDEVQRWIKEHQQPTD